MFPSSLPRPTNANRKETDDNLKAVEESVKSEKGKGKGTSLEELPEGYMGKMLVYKSGAVKLKLGDILYDVSKTPPASCFRNLLVLFVLKFNQHLVYLRSRVIELVIINRSIT